jgi:hypothetical protein
MADRCPTGTCEYPADCDATDHGEALRLATIDQANTEAELNDERALLDGLEQHRLSIRWDHGWIAENDAVRVGFATDARQALREALDEIALRTEPKATCQKTIPQNETSAGAGHSPTPEGRDG